MAGEPDGVVGRTRRGESEQPTASLERTPKARGLIGEKKKIRFFFFSNYFFGIKKSKFANRPKRVLPKFRADPSHVRRVRGRLGGIREA